MPLGVELWLLRRINCPPVGTRGIILPPLTRFYMVCYVTVGSASLTHGWDPITANAVSFGMLRFRGLAPTAVLCHHYVVPYGCFALPWVTLRSTHGCVMSPLCGSMWLPCNNYALCIMNYALKKAHGCVMPPLRGFMWYFIFPWVGTHGCVISPLRGFIWHLNLL